jgi:hypothetical protein
MPAFAGMTVVYRTLICANLYSGFRKISFAGKRIIGHGVHESPGAVSTAPDGALSIRILLPQHMAAISTAVEKKIFPVG